MGDQCDEESECGERAEPDDAEMVGAELDRGPGREDHHQHERDGGEWSGEAHLSLLHVPAGLEGQEGRPVGEGEDDQGQAAEDRERGQEREQALADERPGFVDRDAVQHARPEGPEEERQEEGGDCESDIPRLPPAVIRSLRSVLDGDAPDGERRDDEEQRDVGGGEHRRVPEWEGGEDRDTAHDQPDLVRAPDGPDRGQHLATLGVVTSRQAGQHPDAEVEALEEEEARPEDGDHDEPEGDEVHISGRSVGGRSGRSGRRPARRVRAG